MCGVARHHIIIFYGSLRYGPREGKRYQFQYYSTMINDNMPLKTASLLFIAMLVLLYSIFKYSI